MSKYVDSVLKNLKAKNAKDTPAVQIQNDCLLDFGGSHTNSIAGAGQYSAAIEVASDVTLTIRSSSSGPSSGGAPAEGGWGSLSHCTVATARETHDDAVDMGLAVALAVPAEGAVGEVDREPAVHERSEETRDGLSLGNGIGGDERGARGGVRGHQVR